MGTRDAKEAPSLPSRFFCSDESEGGRIRNARVPWLGEVQLCIIGNPLNEVEGELFAWSEDPLGTTTR